MLWGLAIYVFFFFFIFHHRRAVGLFRPGEKMGMEIFHNNIREQRRPSETARVVKGQERRSVGVLDHHTTIGVRKRPQVKQIENLLHFDIAALVELIRFLFPQASFEADKKFRGIAHRIGLFDRKNIRRFETGPTNRNDERLSQLLDHVVGEIIGIPIRAVLELEKLKKKDYAN